MIDYFSHGNVVSSTFLSIILMKIRINITTCIIIGKGQSFFIGHWKKIYSSPCIFAFA